MSIATNADRANMPTKKVLVGTMILAGILILLSTRYTSPIHDLAIHQLSPEKYKEILHQCEHVAPGRIEAREFEIRSMLSRMDISDWQADRARSRNTIELVVEACLLDEMNKQGPGYATTTRPWP